MRKIIITSLISCILTFVLFKAFDNSQEILVADFKELKGLIIENALLESSKSNQSAEDIVRGKIDQFQISVNQIASNKNALIINKTTVMGSYQDITDDLKLLINDLGVTSD